MNQEFYDFVSKTIGELTGNNVEIDPDKDLESYEVNSLIFIRLIVAIEEKYDFEYGDTGYVYDKMNTLNSIYNVTKEYVASLN